MMTWLSRLKIAGLALLAVACGASASEPLSSGYYGRVSDKAFADVVLDLQFVISRHNFRITGRNNISNAVRGRGGHADFPDAMVVNFCNVEYAREAIEIDPRLMVYMPCKVALLQRPDGVLVQTLLLPTTSGREEFDAFGVRINKILQSIVDYAVSNN